MGHSKLRKVIRRQEFLAVLRYLGLELFNLLGSLFVHGSISCNELVVPLDHGFMMCNFTLDLLHVELFEIHCLLEYFLRPVQIRIELIPLLLKFAKSCLVFLAIIDSTMKFLP